MQTKGNQRWAGLLALVLAAATTACSGDDASGDSGDDDESGGTSGGGGTSGTSSGGSSGSGATGTGLPAGTACIQVAQAAETCFPSGAAALRMSLGGQMTLGVSHAATPHECGMLNRGSFDVRFSIPDDVSFPYQVSGMNSSLQRVNDGSCEWNNQGFGYPISGTVFQAATNGSTNIEADVSMQTVGTICDGLQGNCPDVVTARARFNISL